MLIIRGSHRVLLACTESLVPEYSLGHKALHRLKSEPLLGGRRVPESLAPHYACPSCKRSLRLHDAVHSPGMLNRILDDLRSKLCQPKYSFLVGMRLRALA